METYRKGEILLGWAKSLAKFGVPDLEKHPQMMRLSTFDVLEVLILEVQIHFFLPFWNDVGNLAKESVAIDLF